MRLTELEVLVVDCQATLAGTTGGHLLELGWAAVNAGPVNPSARLIKLPPGERVPPGVARITGITDRMLAEALAPAEAWAELRAACAALTQPAPAIAHFARFERPFLERLAGGPPPLELVCTHEIARRLLPTLPRKSLRALAGYFGRAVTPLHRSAEHVTATAFVWRALIGLLSEAGVETWPQLAAWLKQPVAARKRGGRRGWPMPRELRLALPHTPGLYRFLRTGGDVLYIGKAASLNHRVNSYFRKRRGTPERTLELLSQARGLTFEVTPSPLEAALLEPDEIKKHRPPYNVALTNEDRELWFVSGCFGRRSPHPSQTFELGPFPSGELLDQLAALVKGEARALGRGRWGPPPELFEPGQRQFVAIHPELSQPGRPAHSRLLRLGARLWRDGRRDRELDQRLEDDPAGPPTWTMEQVIISLERLALRAALAVRRARWLTRLVESSLVWSERGVDGARLLVVANGELERRAAARGGEEPPLPEGHRRSRHQRHQGFTVARLDRLRVLTTELKRLVADGDPVALRLGPGCTFTGPRLARVLDWL